MAEGVSVEVFEFASRDYHLGVEPPSAAPRLMEFLKEQVAVVTVEPVSPAAPGDMHVVLVPVGPILSKVLEGQATVGKWNTLYRKAPPPSA